MVVIRLAVLVVFFAYAWGVMAERQREAMDSCLKKFSESTCVYTLR